MTADPVVDLDRYTAKVTLTGTDLLHIERYVNPNKPESVLVAFGVRLCTAMRIAAVSLPEAAYMDGFPSVTVMAAKRDAHCDALEVSEAIRETYSPLLHPETLARRDRQTWAAGWRARVAFDVTDGAAMPPAKLTAVLERAGSPSLGLGVRPGQGTFTVAALELTSTTHTARAAEEEDQMTTPRTSTHYLDMRALFEAIEEYRQVCDISRNQLGDTLGLSPSTLTRMAQGGSPSADGLVSILYWLGQPAEMFTRLRPPPKYETWREAAAETHPGAHVTGDGRFAAVNRCRADVCISLHASETDATSAKNVLDAFGCGTSCTKRHAVVEL